MKEIILVLIFLITAVAKGQTQPLSQEALFHRCYSQLTQSFPFNGNVTLEQVKNGEIDAITACINILDSAQLTVDNETVANVADTDATSTLLTLHYLHASWFENTEFASIGDVLQRIGMSDIYDTSTPAAYFTKATFDGDMGADEVLTSTQHLRLIRENYDLGVSFFSSPQLMIQRSDYIFGNDMIFAGQGPLQGIEVMDEMVWNYSYFDAFLGSQVTGTESIGLHFGGGVLGSAPYLLMTVNEEIDFRSDGGVEVPRRWSRSVFHDLLCRDLPVIRKEDAEPYVVENSEIQFRKSESCVQCHATIDRMASTVRNFSYSAHGAIVNTPAFGGIFASFTPPTLPAELGWPAVTDPNHFRRPPNGTLYYRNYKGQLVNEAVSNADEMGAALAQQDDFYICWAKRYYHYFTGIDVYVGDISDPAQEYSQTDFEIYHRDEVIRLGLELKGHKDPLQTIKDILTSEDYSKPDFGVSDSRSVASE